LIGKNLIKPDPSSREEYGIELDKLKKEKNNIYSEF
jgi:hypothetical protein